MSTKTLAGRLHCVLERAANDAEVPGAMAAVHAPRLGFEWRDGVRGSRSRPEEAWHADLPFRIASVTKLFTAAAALRLVESGRLRLAAPIGTLISRSSQQALAAGGHDPVSITVSQLLTHTSGLADHASGEFENEVKASPRRVWTRLDQVRIAAGMSRAPSPPGRDFHYSDTGYVLLGEIVERCMDMPLGQAARQLLGFERLGLHRTHWESHEADPVPGERARQWIGDFDASGLDPSFDLHGGGGIVSTVDDLCRFMRALLQGGVFREPATLAAALIVPPAERPAGSYVHGRVAMVLPVGETWGWGHLGYWGCGVVHCPDLDITVAATINQPHPASANLRRDLISELGRLVVAAQCDCRDPDED